eukprot:scpid29546/ scgid7383/ 
MPHAEGTTAIAEVSLSTASCGQGQELVTMYSTWVKVWSPWRQPVVTVTYHRLLSAISGVVFCFCVTCSIPSAGAYAAYHQPAWPNYPCVWCISTSIRTMLAV